jgi:Putative zinc-finger
MTHLELENLASDYLEGLLAPPSRAAVEAHLAQCAACRELVGDVRRVMELCRAAEQVEPAPWLVSKILLATVGERKPTLREQIAALFRPMLQPRVAYPIAMTVFAFSVIVNAAGINLRSLQIEDLNPRTWVFRANRSRHLVCARAEKFLYDLRVVYEVESRLRQLRGQIQEQEEEVLKNGAPSGGSSKGAPAEQDQVASAEGLRVEPIARTIGNQAGLAGPGRSVIP